MSFSVSLHTAEPNLDGNQRTREAHYQNYNRAEATMEIIEGGNGVVKLVDLKFPAPGDDSNQTFLFYSIGVCEGVPQGHGGSIINYGPLPEPLVALKDAAPVIADELVGVYAARLAEMRADGRMGPAD